MNIKITIRLALQDDILLIEEMMKRSMKILAKGYYSSKQIDSCCQFVCVPDLQLIYDKTFFVATINKKTIIGCGGWSFRNTLYAGPKQNSQKALKLNPSFDYARIRAMFTDPNYSRIGVGSMILDESEKAAKKQGFSKVTLGATLSGIDFYVKKGWKYLKKEQATLPDGVSIGVIKMEKIF